MRVLAFFNVHKAAKYQPPTKVHIPLSSSSDIWNYYSGIIIMFASKKAKLILVRLC